MTSIALPKTQLANPADLAFIQLELVGEGITGSLSHDGAEFLPVSSELTATISDIPIEDGALRVVRVIGYDADQNPLGSFLASGYYRSESGTTTINIMLNRVQLLLGAILTELLSSNPELLPDLDLAGLQAALEEATGFNADTGEFVTDPSRYDPSNLVALVVSDSPSLPSATDINSEDRVVTQDLTLTLNLPSGAGYVLDENIRLLIDDPNSAPKVLESGTEHGIEVTFSGVIVGSWSLSAYDSEGNKLVTTSVNVDGSSASAVDNPLSLTAALDVLAPVGEFKVNTETSSNQKKPSVGVDADGNYVIAWESRGQDGDGNGVYAQRFNAAGVVQGSEFQVNTYTTGEQDTPSVGMASEGVFVIAWESVGQDGDNKGIYAQRYDSSGGRVGETEFQVNTYTTGSQNEPSVGIDANGDFVIAWASYDQDNDNSSGIYAQRFNADGTKPASNGSEFQAHTYTTSKQSSPSIGMDDDGDFVIAWRSRDQDGDVYGVYAQRFNADGTKPASNGSEFRVNTQTSHSQQIVSVAMDSDGDFVIAWESENQDGNNYGIYAQRFNADGTKPASNGSEFRVNTYTGSLKDPSVGMDDDGNFVVAWRSNAQDGNEFGIYAQRFNSSGTAQDSEFLVNTQTTNDQQFCSVGMGDDGDFVIAWESEDQDGAGYGIYAQRYNALGEALMVP